MLPTRGGTRLILKLEESLKIQKTCKALLGTQDVTGKEKKYVTHNCHHFPLVLTKGEGVFVWDVEGKRYFDYLSGYFANNFGHCHPKIVEALRDQSTMLHHSSRFFHYDKLGEYAEVITRLFGYDKVVPLTTGREAGDTAYKIASKWGCKKKDIPNNKILIVTAANNSWEKPPTDNSDSINPSNYEKGDTSLQGYICVPYSDLKALEAALQEPFVCAYMMEPIQGDAGVIIPSEGYLKGVRELCTKYGILWIADETQTGLGRTGRNLAVDHEDVKPDILMLGNSLGAGVFSVAACLASDEILSVIDPDTIGPISGGNPLAAKVAMASLEVLEEENIAANAFKMGRILRGELRKKLDNRIVLEVRGRGLLNALVINRNHTDAWDICQKLKERGLISIPTHKDIIRLTPPLTISEEQIRESSELIVQTINSIETS
ncbi:hypothetical protein JTB14_002398 [Gonioctena quinquepunctata]|nr:hypothetical protein JTB14_002398 [Gonioctena quinquepunctata]